MAAILGTWEIRPTIAPMSFLLAIRNWCGAHKKLTATIIGAAVSLIPDKVLDQVTKTKIVETIMVYVAGQGVADMGKERAKIEVAAAGGGPSVKSE